MNVTIFSLVLIAGGAVGALLLVTIAFAVVKWMGRA